MSQPPYPPGPPSVQPVLPRYGYAPPGYPPYGYPMQPPMMAYLPRIRRRRHPAFPGAGWAFLAAGVGLVVLLGGGAVWQWMLASRDAAAGGISDGTRSLIHGLIFPHTLFSLLIVPLLIVGWRCRIIRTLSLRRPHVPLLLLMIPVGFFLQVLLGAFSHWFSTLLPEDLQQQARDLIRRMWLCRDAGQWVLATLAISISPGIFEELLFRGILQNGLQASPLGRKGALMVTAGVFTVAHMSPVSMVPLFVAGLLLGYVALQTGTIWYGVVLHAVFNFTAVWFSNVTLAGTSEGSGLVPMQWPPPMLLMAAVVLPLCAVPFWIWTRPRRAAVISGAQVDPDLEIDLAGPPPAALEQLPDRPRLGTIATTAFCLGSLAIPAICYLVTWTHFHPGPP